MYYISLSIKGLLQIYVRPTHGNVYGIGGAPGAVPIQIPLTCAK